MRGGRQPRRHSDGSDATARRRAGYTRARPPSNTVFAPALQHSAFSRTPTQRVLSHLCPGASLQERALQPARALRNAPDACGGSLGHPARRCRQLPLHAQLRHLLPQAGVERRREQLLHEASGCCGVSGRGDLAALAYSSGSGLAQPMELSTECRR